MKNRTLYHLLHKEFSESVRNHKILIIVVTFLFFGVLSPLTAMYMPELMKMIGAQQGMVMEVKPPSAQDSLMQLHSNIIQAALFIMIFLVAGMISQEKEQGTAAFLLVKPVSRDIFIVSKYIALSGFIFIGMASAIAICGIYTFILFGTVPMGALLKMSLFLFAYLLIILSISLFLSSLFSSQIFAGVGTFLIWLLLEGLSALPKIGQFLPGGVSREARAAAAGMSPGFTPLIGAAVLIVSSIVLSIYSFRRWES